MELPIPAELTPNIQIAKVPTDCQSLHEGNENVIAIGTGRNTINQTRYIKIILQQVEFTTLSSDDCGQVARGMNQRALVCVNSESGESILNGDSGNFGIILSIFLKDSKSRSIVRVSGKIRIVQHFNQNERFHRWSADKS